MPRLRSIGRRPTLWVELALAAAWLALLAGEGAARNVGGTATGPAWASGPPLWICHLGVAGTRAGHSPSLASASLLAGFPMWGLMALAMMVPTAMPAVHHVAGKSLYWRRRRASVEFLAVFLGLWIAFSLLALSPLSSWRPTASSFAFPIALGAAALWQLTPLKLRALRACHRTRPLPPRGWRATAGVADFALRNGAACLASCWAMMAAGVISGPGRLLWMGAISAAMTIEKLSDKPLTASRRGAALLAAAAVGVAAADLLA
jgi:predicted metal-binding membrane protein